MGLEEGNHPPAAWHEGGKDTIYRINYKDIANGKDFSQNLKLRVDDTIIVP
jgi:hypothetical protein